MVLTYVPKGSLRNYLQDNHLNLTIKDRFKLLRSLCQSLYDIHKKDLIHCDLHSGNILMQGGNCFITDLGLCGPVDEKSSNKVYGIVSYVAPELLRGNNMKNTKETDIYSVGMLMWEIFAGHPPFDDITKLTEGGFSSIYTAEWTRGEIVDYDENKKEFSYFGGLRVVLKSLNDSSNPGKAFFDEVGSCHLKQNKQYCII